MAGNQAKGRSWLRDFIISRYVVWIDVSLLLSRITAEGILEPRQEMWEPNIFALCGTGFAVCVSVQQLFKSLQLLRSHPWTLESSCAARRSKYQIGLRASAGAAGPFFWAASLRPLRERLTEPNPWRQVAKRLTEATEAFEFRAKK